MDIEFSRNLIKGKIAELIFELMFKSSGEFTVIPFGYEHSQPELAQYINILKEKEILETLRHTPDFLLISKDRKEVYMVEVKYRNKLDTQEIKQAAENLVKRWNHAYLFIATPRGFYYEPCHSIINNNGVIGELFKSHVSLETQEKYLDLLNEFEKK